MILSYYQDINLTNDQKDAVIKISDFLSSENDIFILKGYAGSGKSTILRGLIDYLEQREIRFLLMAPTGRAANVLSRTVKRNVTTIHKAIYSYDDLVESDTSESVDSGTFKFFYKLRPNNDSNNWLYIVDEASMVSDALIDGEFFRFGSGYLLSDLISFTKMGWEFNKAKILFVGDPAQLPPVGMTFSPALDETYLRNKFSLNTISTELKEVKRQSDSSAIVAASMRIRRCLTSGFYNDFDLSGNDNDIINLRHEDFISTYQTIDGDKIIITYKNKTALDINQLVRFEKFGAELQIQSGDQIIIGNNNYNLRILNGEFGIVVSCSSETIKRNVVFTTTGGTKINIRLEWRYVELLMPDDSEGDKIVKGYMLENFLYGDNFLDGDEHRALYVDFKNRLKEDYERKNLKPPNPKSSNFKEALKEDRFFNAILLKFGYAVTCHKAQGGEWQNAFIFWDFGVKDDQGYTEVDKGSDGRTNPLFYRWAYTAITRAAKKLVCISPPSFNSFTNMTLIPSKVLKARQELIGKLNDNIEVLVNNDMLIELERNGLRGQSVRIQDHYLKTRYLVRNQYIKISRWERVNYEIRYQFEREGKKAGLKFWINAEEKFNNKWMAFVPWTTSEELIHEVWGIFNNMPKIDIVRNSIETIEKSIEFHWDIDEKYPFLEILYEKAKIGCAGHNITITDVEHLDWRDRYTFIRGNERAVLDFEYTSKGFFGRVVPIEKLCSGSLLIHDIEAVILDINPNNNVI